MFSWSSAAPDSLFLRKDIDNRGDYQTDTYSVTPGAFKWEKLKDKVVDSRENADLYPFTEAFLSQTSISHLRKGPSDSTLIVNNYGPVDSAEFGTYWSMVSQSIVTNSNSSGTYGFVSAKNVDKGILSLVGRFQQQGSSTTWASHIGLKTSNNGVITEVWNNNIDDGNSSWTEGDVTYGAFSTDTSDIGMLKYWYTDSGKTAKLEVWRLPATLNQAPTKVQQNWTTNPIEYVTILISITFFI